MVCIAVVLVTVVEIGVAKVLVELAADFVVVAVYTFGVVIVEFVAAALLVAAEVVGVVEVGPEVVDYR